MSGDFEHVSVMASVRAHARLQVHKDFLRPEKEAELKAEIIRQIDQEGDPGAMHHWTPESFCQQTDLYLSDQQVAIDEQGTWLLDRIRVVVSAARNSALRQDLLQILSEAS